MATSRRGFLKAAGAAGAIAASGRMGMAETKSAGVPAKGFPKGLTLLTFRKNGEYRVGAKLEKGVLDVVEASRMLKIPAPATLDEMLERNEGAAVNAVVAAAAKSSSAQKALIKEDGIEYGPVVTRPEKILCIGLNYRRHAQEIGLKPGKVPVLFSKFNNALSAHNQPVKLPTKVAEKFDYEIELVIVMGKGARDVSEDEALSYVAGYATGNDFTARDLQFDTGGQWLIGKTPDQFAPLGPYFVSADLVPDPNNLKLECRVNGETRQDWSTNDMIFNCKQLIRYLSGRMTLKPGDVIFTGTPQGVIWGYPPEKRVWLKPGDKIACSVEKLGELKFDLA